LVSATSTNQTINARNTTNAPRLSRFRPGERVGADQHAERDLDEVDGAAGTFRRSEGVEADQHRRHADEGVERRDQFRHLGHLDPARDRGADHGADGEHRDDQQAGDKDRLPVRRVFGRQREGVDDRGHEGQRHADHAGDVAHAGGRLPGEAGEGEDEEDTGDDVEALDELQQHLRPPS
jgi:hypothetical protein